ncbi:hypothetical protein C8R43DRAFT_1124264 [Mycena crocata]|nr:hypothetical protein C8R43DRAFT_1124264 [Mycena crocata]
MPCKIPFFPNHGNFKSRKEHDDNGRKKWYVVDDIGLFTSEADALALTDDYHIFTTRFKALLHWDADCARRHTHGENDVVPDSKPNSDEDTNTPESDDDEVNTPARPISSRSPAPATTRSTSVKRSVKREASSVKCEASVKPERVSVKPERISIKRELKREVSLPSPKHSLYADDSDEPDAVVGHNDGNNDNGVNPMLTVQEDENHAAQRKRPVPPVSRGGHAKHARPSPSCSPPRSATASRVASCGPTPTDISPTVDTHSATSPTWRHLPVVAPDLRSPTHPRSRRHWPRAPPLELSTPTRAATAAPHTGAPAGSASRGGALRGAPRRAASAIPRGERVHYSPPRLEGVLDESASRAPAAHHSKAPSASASASTSGAASQAGSPSERLFFNKNTQTLYKTVEQCHMHENCL